MAISRRTALKGLTATGAGTLLASDEVASGLSQLNFWVDRLEFAASVVDLHLPVDAALDAVEVARPGCSLRSQGRDIAEAAVGHALRCQAAQFVLGDVEPTAVLGRVAELDATDQLARPGRGEA